MGDTGRESESQPQIESAQTMAERNGAIWKITWDVKNIGSRPLQILSARLPHGQFRAGETRFNPPSELRPWEKTQFQSSVRCDASPGLVTENAFIIFQVLWLGDRWRIFVRLRVTGTQDGRPETMTESVTMQRVGFSEVQS